MRKLNPSHVTALINLINHGPFIEHLSMVINELGVGYCFLEVDVQEKQRNPFGGIHGGVYASLIVIVSWKKMQEWFLWNLRLIM